MALSFINVLLLLIVQPIFYFFCFLATPHHRFWFWRCLYLLRCYCFCTKDKKHNSLKFSLLFLILNCCSCCSQLDHFDHSSLCCFQAHSCLLYSLFAFVPYWQLPCHKCVVFLMIRSEFNIVGFNFNFSVLPHFITISLVYDSG